MITVAAHIIHISASAELVEPLGVAHADHGSRFMMTIKVDNVDAVCTELRAHGVTMLNDPIDRPGDGGRRHSLVLLGMFEK